MSDFSEMVTGAIAAASAVAAIAAAVSAHGSREAAASANQLAEGLADRAAILELLAIAHQVQSDARTAIRLSALARGTARGAATLDGNVPGSAFDQAMRAMDEAIGGAERAAKAAEETIARFGGRSSLDDSARDEVHRRRVVLDSLRHAASASRQEVEQAIENGQRSIDDHGRSREAERLVLMATSPGPGGPG